MKENNKEFVLVLDYFCLYDYFDLAGLKPFSFKVDQLQLLFPAYIDKIVTNIQI